MTGTRNWAGNVVFGARRLHGPESVEDLQEIVTGSERVRALGTGHSFSRVADTDGDLVSLAALPPRAEWDGTRITVAGGLTYADVTRAVHAAGRALPNLGSLPHISVAGACATGTHGSGDALGVLATAVSALELVRADGSLATLRRGDPGFDGSVVALGAAGIVTALTLDTVPGFDVAQWVLDDVPHDGFDALPDILAAGYSVSGFTRWSRPVFDQVWCKRPAAGGPPPHLGGHPADAQRHMTLGEPPEHCTPQLGVPGPWHERLPHFRAGFRPSSGAELQSEYLVPRADGPAALRAVAALAPVIAPVLLVFEVRSVAADGLWLSPAHDRDSVALHATWVLDEQAVMPVVAELERALEPFAARPHWGKVFSAVPERVRELLPRLPEAAALLREHDPDGRFRNAMLDAYLP